MDHKILLKKLQRHGIKGKNLPWFESYLTGRKQYINIEINDNTAKPVYNDHLGDEVSVGVRGRWSL